MSLVGVHIIHDCRRPADRAIQYSRALAIIPRGSAVLDTPLEPVIGLAKGETRWRGMTS